MKIKRNIMLKEVVVKYYDKENEELKEENLTIIDERNYEKNLRNKFKLILDIKVVNKFPITLIFTDEEVQEKVKKELENNIK